MINYVKSTLANHVISICNDAHILAVTGLLDGKRAITNKWMYSETIKYRPEINWVHRASWVHENRFWTSSGISAGIDLAAAFVIEVYSKKIGQLVTDILGYTPELNPDNDPFVDTVKSPKYDTEWDCRNTSGIGIQYM